ncbi:MAG: adenosine kinase [Bacteroidales bacterium]|jgi:sugar/nucleoside kinase (ribokinase family)|nr:adenosine kinase [Bacteroidales bacterium]
MANIIGLGNALVDIIVFIDKDELLEQLELPKGSMQLVDIERSGRIREACRHLQQSFASGGSAANTIHAIARLGVHASFIGKVGNDDYGQIFREDLEKHNIKPILFYSGTHSGRAVALISPDKERTFATHLGAAIELSSVDIKAEHFNGHNIFHIEGYMAQDHALLEKALQIAKEQGMEISIDMASYNVVEENREFLRAIVKEYVDIVFANEEEAKSFTGKPPEKALDEIADMCKIAVVKTGKEGSLVKSGDMIFRIPAISADVVDTNGAGDIYAAGFLYGYSQGWPLDKCASAGGILAGKLIEITGARLSEEGWEKALKMIDKL